MCTVRIDRNEKVRDYFRAEFDIDIVRTYERLKSIGKISADKINDRVELMRAINTAGKSAFAANILFLKARREKEMFQIEYNSKLRELTRLAIARISAWLESSTNVRKQITNDMVEQEICSAPSTKKEYRQLLAKREELREICDAMESLAKQWSDRKSALQSQARLLESKKEVILGRR